MVLDIAKPVALLMAILSLYSVFHAAFLIPATSFQERIDHALIRLAFAVAICTLGALLFRESDPPRRARPKSLFAMLPMQLLCWATGAMLLLFAASWYLETYYIPYRDFRP